MGGASLGIALAIGVKKIATLKLELKQKIYHMNDHADVVNFIEFCPCFLALPLL